MMYKTRNKFKNSIVYLNNSPPRPRYSGPYKKKINSHNVSPNSFFEIRDIPAFLLYLFIIFVIIITLIILDFTKFIIISYIIISCILYFLLYRKFRIINPKVY